MRFNVNQTKRVCEFCDTSFSVPNFNKHTNSCKKNPKNFKSCPVCDKQFSGKGTTCSYACSNTHFNHIRNKPKAYRTICWKYHKKECIVCGENKIVSVHHLNEDHSDNSPENLIPLCPTHHQYMHSRYKEEIVHIIEKYVRDNRGVA